jgi:hypothetical protein
MLNSAFVRIGKPYAEIFIDTEMPGKFLWINALRPIAAECASDRGQTILCPSATKLLSALIGATSLWSQSLRFPIVSMAIDRWDRPWLDLFPHVVDNGSGIVI